LIYSINKLQAENSTQQSLVHNLDSKSLKMNYVNASLIMQFTMPTSLLHPEASTLAGQPSTFQLESSDPEAAQSKRPSCQSSN